MHPKLKPSINVVSPFLAKPLVFEIFQLVFPALFYCFHSSLQYLHNLLWSSPVYFFWYQVQLVLPEINLRKIVVLCKTFYFNLCILVVDNIFFCFYFWFQFFLISCHCILQLFILLLNIDYIFILGFFGFFKKTTKLKCLFLVLLFTWLTPIWLPWRAVETLTQDNRP